LPLLTAGGFRAMEDATAVEPRRIEIERET